MADQALIGFVVGAWLLAVAVVTLARASADLIAASDEPDSQESQDAIPGPDTLSEADDGLHEPSQDHFGDTTAHSLETISTDLLLLNVLVTQGGVIVLLAAGAVLTGVPLETLGVASVLPDTGVLLLGLAVGLGLYLVDEVLSVVARRFGYVPDALLRTALTPGTTGGWVLLVSVILPLVALGEELLFRAALLGATPLVGGIPTLAILLLSSLLFGLAHAVQGRAGVVVASVLGLGLGSAYLLTGNLLVVVIAHYLVNVLEFVVHELLGLGSG